VSGVNQVEALFDPLHTLVHPIKSAGHAGILVFKNAETLLNLDHVFSNALHGPPDGAKMLKNNVIGGHVELDCLSAISV
jgi:hypothetical protein